MKHEVGSKTGCCVWSATVIEVYGGPFSQAGGSFSAHYQGRQWILYLGTLDLFGDCLSVFCNVRQDMSRDEHTAS